ncbi:MAG TPA: glycosyltransferase family A protein [Thermomonas sp.]|nr:glycosyltransferase family A protein [Dokdonella sp.]HQY50123.1 glycosyltransferase family A protein [Thermomonas sp.]
MPTDSSAAKIPRTGFPLVSIGLPVYNEARFIEASLASLRNQDYPNLEIIISDNASTDNSLEICKRHGAEDDRIRIETLAVNHGAIANFRRTLDLANGEFFMWASGHDLWSPDLVSSCVAELQENGNACLAFASSHWIGAQGEALMRSSGWTDTRGLSAVARLFTIFWGNMHPILGVMRMSQLRACRPLLNITGSDLVLLSDMVLRGDFVHALQPSWYRREFREETEYQAKLDRYASPSVAISKSRLQRIFPLLQLPFALNGVVMRSTLPATDKIATLIALWSSFLPRYLVGRRKNFP